MEFLAAAPLSVNGIYPLLGVADATFISHGNILGGVTYSAGAWSESATQVSAGFTANYQDNLPSAVQNDVFQIAVDFAAGGIWFGKNNVWSNSSNPTTGTLPIISFVPATVGALFAAQSFVFMPGNGSWTLQSTAASQKYAPPSGFSAWDSAAPTHSAQALAYLARTVGGNEGGNGANIATLIDGLVSDGVWAKLDALYVLAQQNATDALLNLVGTSYGMTTVGLLKDVPSLRSAPFTSYVGFGPFVAQYLATGFNPSTATSPQFTQNSASFGVWTIASVVEPVSQMGNSIAGSSGESHIYNDFTDGNFYARLNNATVGGVPVPGTKGLFVGDRASSSAVVPYWNGTAQASQSSTSQAPLNSPFDVGAATGAGSTGQQLSAAFIGASLGAAGQLALYNRLRTYMTSIGVP